MPLIDDAFLDMVRSIRAIPGELGVRPHRVYLVEVDSTGSTWGEGTVTTTETEITEDGQPPKVSQANDEQRALGNLADGALRIGPITPPSSGAGITATKLNGSSLTAGTDSLRIRVAGPLGDNYYTISSKTQESATKWMLTVEPVAPKP
jgi:hypothetical protein